MSDPTRNSTNADLKHANSANGNAADASLSDAELDAVAGGWPSDASIPHTPAADVKGGKQKRYDFTDPGAPINIG